MPLGRRTRKERGKDKDTKMEKGGEKRDISISVQYEEYVKIKLSTDCYT